MQLYFVRKKFGLPRFILLTIIYETSRYYRKDRSYTDSINVGNIQFGIIISRKGAKAQRQGHGCWVHFASKV